MLSSPLQFAMSHISLKERSFCDMMDVISMACFYASTKAETFKEQPETKTDNSGGWISRNICPKLRGRTPN